MINSLYSKTNLIKKVSFINGLNLVIGKKNEGNPNGIGKSSLVRLIDYIFLSTTAAEIFKDTKYDFLREENHSISLDFEINNKVFTITRLFKSNKIFFGRIGKEEEITGSELSSLLLQKMFPIKEERVSYTGNVFRAFMKFFIKDDLNNMRRFNPCFFFGNPSASLREIAKYNFFLLNIPTLNIIETDKYVKDRDIIKKTITKLEKDIKEDTGKEISEIKTNKIKIEEKIKTLSKELEDYNFLESYKDYEKDLVTLTTAINKLLDKYYLIKRKKESMRENLNFSNDIDLSKIQNLYNETIDTLGNIVKKSLEDVIYFQKQIIDNRNKFITEYSLKLKEQENTILKEITLLEDKRSKIYKLLEKKGALDTVKNTFESLTNEKIKLEKNSMLLKQIENLQMEVMRLNTKIQEKKLDILDDLKEYSEQINKLRKLFIDIVNDTTGNMGDSYFDIPISEKAKLLPFENITVKIPREHSFGQTKFSLIVYDLMIFFNIIQEERNLPNFLIHDGVFHGIAHLTQAKILNKIYEYSKKFMNFQYIATFNEEEIINLKEQLSFDYNKHVIVTYADETEKKIFKRNLDN